MKQKKIEIDSEFEAMIPPLSVEESAALEENLLRNGCRHALVVWNGVLVDGHNRYKICKKLGIPFRTTPLERIDSRESVIAWMIDNQLARRNLTAFQRIDLAAKKGDVIAALAEKRKAAGTNQHSSLPSDLTEGSAIDTRNEIAKAAGVSTGTMSKFKKIKESAVPEVIEKARSGEIKIDVAAQVATLPKDEQVALAAAGPDALKAAARDLRKSKQDKSVAEDAKLESTDCTANPKTDSPSKDRDELIRLRAENAELRERVKQLTKASKSPELKYQLADAREVTERLNKRCVELNERIAALENENEVLVQRLGMQSQEDHAGQRQTDAIEEHVGNVEMNQGVIDDAVHAAAAVALGFPAASAEASTHVNVLETVDLNVIDIRCAEKGDR
jgi:transcriptional regulator with XRE-family HTH domain